MRQGLSLLHLANLSRYSTGRVWPYDWCLQTRGVCLRLPPAGPADASAISAELAEGADQRWNERITQGLNHNSGDVAFYQAPALHLRRWLSRGYRASFFETGAEKSQAREPALTFLVSGSKASRTVNQHTREASIHQAHLSRGALRGASPPVPPTTVQSR